MFHTMLYKAILVYCTPSCAITLTKIFVLLAFLFGTWLSVTTGWVILAGSIATWQCASAGPHWRWPLAMVGVGDCGNNLRNVGRCQGAYFGTTAFFCLFWFRRSPAVWALPFHPSDRVLVFRWGIFSQNFGRFIWR